MDRDPADPEVQERVRQLPLTAFSEKIKPGLAHFLNFYAGNAVIR